MRPTSHDNTRSHSLQTVGQPLLSGYMLCTAHKHTGRQDVIALTQRRFKNTSDVSDVAGDRSVRMMLGCGMTLLGHAEFEWK